MSEEEFEAAVNALTAVEAREALDTRKHELFNSGHGLPKVISALRARVRAG